MKNRGTTYENQDKIRKTVEDPRNPRSYFLSAIFLLKDIGVSKAYRYLQRSQTNWVIGSFQDIPGQCPGSFLNIVAWAFYRTVLVWIVWRHTQKTGKKKPGSSRTKICSTFCGHFPESSRGPKIVITNSRGIRKVRKTKEKKQKEKKRKQQQQQ